MLFALLLVNVFVVKEVHYVLEQHHDHAHSLVDRHADCSKDIHFHSHQFEADCHICDFSFSPTELSETGQIVLNPLVPFNRSSFYKGIFIDAIQGILPAPRGPPVGLILLS